MIEPLFPALAVAALIFDLGRWVLCPVFLLADASALAVVALIDRRPDNNLEHSKGRYPSGRV